MQIPKNCNSENSENFQFGKIQKTSQILQCRKSSNCEEARNFPEIFLPYGITVRFITVTYYKLLKSSI